MSEKKTKERRQLGLSGRQVFVDDRTDMKKNPTFSEKEPKKVRQNNKKHTKARVKYGGGAYESKCNNVPYRPKEQNENPRKPRNKRKSLSHDKD